MPNKDWVEAEFNPSALELARMSKLLEEADRYMVWVKCGKEAYMRVSYAILTQVLDYFYFILEKGHKDNFDTMKGKLNKSITAVERINLTARKRGKELPVGTEEESNAIDLLVKFQSMVYHYKGVLGLGIVFKKRMASEDILDSALGIENLDKQVEQTEEDLEFSEEELGELPKEEEVEEDGNDSPEDISQ